MLINANVETLVLQLPSHVSESKLQDVVAMSFLAQQKALKPGTEWIAFIGEEPHWAGLTRWVAISEAAEVVVDSLQSLLEAANVQVGREGCNPSRHESLQPSVRFSDEGLELLMPPEDVAYVAIIKSKHLRVGQRVIGPYQGPNVVAD